MILDSFEKRNVVLGVGASITAVQAADFARLLVSRGYQVRVVMTDDATSFLSPQCFEVITGNPVVTSFEYEAGIESTEIAALTAWADGIVIAPATPDEVAGIRYGLTSSPLLAVALASSLPTVLAVVAPKVMLHGRKMQEHFSALEEDGVRMLFADESVEPLGVEGVGTMADTYQLFYETRKALSVQDYLHKHVVIATGSSREYLDKVRYFARRSSGKIGIALAREAHRRGAQVTLVHGAIGTPVPDDVATIRAVTTDAMHDTISGLVADGNNPPDVVIMAAALSDYAPAQSGEGKLQFEGASVMVTLEQKPDVLSTLSEQASKNDKRPLLVGFSETSVSEDDPVEVLRMKIGEKGMDVLVGNMIEERLRGENHHWVLDRLGRQTEVSSPYKSRVADSILTAIARLF